MYLVIEGFKNQNKLKQKQRKKTELKQTNEQTKASSTGKETMQLWTRNKITKQ